MKIFVASDIHSYYSIFKEALDKSGYDYNNENHLLVLCGDYFDRGNESQEVLNFLNEHNKRTILLRGNHEDLMLECLERGFFENHDISNGTVRTIMDLGNQSEHYKGMFPDDAEAYQAACNLTYAKLKPLIDSTINYFETKNYIFVHSWIPCNFKVDDSKLIKMGYMSYNNPIREYNPNWKNAYMEEWNEARWNNPFKLAFDGFNQTGKTIVFGHWHTSWYHAVVKGTPEFEEGACFDIAYDKENKAIGIDACTAASGKCNILVLDDDLLS